MPLVHLYYFANYGWRSAPSHHGATPHRVVLELLMERPANPLGSRLNFSSPWPFHRFDSFGVGLLDVIVDQIDREVLAKIRLRRKPEVLAAGLVVVDVKSTAAVFMAYAA